MTSLTAPLQLVRSSFSFTGLLASCLLGSSALVGCSGEAELFEKASASTEAAERTVGNACSLSFELGAGETVVEENSECAAPGFCLGHEGEVACSCRCSGDASLGALCACPTGFVCRDDVISSLGTGDDEYVGGYCLPAP